MICGGAKVKFCDGPDLQKARDVVASWINNKVGIETATLFGYSGTLPYVSKSYLGLRGRR